MDNGKRQGLQTSNRSYSFGKSIPFFAKISLKSSCPKNPKLYLCQIWCDFLNCIIHGLLRLYGVTETHLITTIIQYLQWYKMRLSQERLRKFALMLFWEICALVGYLQNLLLPRQSQRILIWASLRYSPFHTW